MSVRNAVNEDCWHDPLLSRSGRLRPPPAISQVTSLRRKSAGRDAIYAASADLVGGHWVTADLRAHRRIERLRISPAACQGEGNPCRSRRARREGDAVHPRRVLAQDLSLDALGL